MKDGVSEQDLADLVPDIRRFFYRREHNPHVAEELEQETVTRCLENLSGCKASSPAMLRSWAFGVAKNVLREHCREVTRIRQKQEGFSGWRGQAPRVPEQERAHLEREQLRRVLARLSDDHEEIVTLRFIEHKAPAEIAKILGISQKTVGTRLHRAREALRHLFEEGQDHD